MKIGKKEKNPPRGDMKEMIWIKLQKPTKLKKNIEKTKCWLYEKVKINKPLVILIRKKRKHAFSIK